MGLDYIFVNYINLLFKKTDLFKYKKLNKIFYI